MYEAFFLLPKSAQGTPTNPKKGATVRLDYSPTRKTGVDEPRRSITDHEGRRWTVFESPSTYDRRKLSLVFYSLDVIRRVRNYPADWHEWTDAALLDLSMRS